ncbi:peptide MFS transporter [Legionella sp. W05-934-2]|jgi:POT family proton-dependent oligopeptide transporter|uniref:peptide MFS transporter n=1 Tax=Legionella sp. W05-934-2 TaxID=1198649 RepID=UPI0034623779
MPTKLSANPASTMPAGVVPLFFIQIVCTLGFSVLYSSLVLYMTNKLGFDKSLSSLIMGVFVAYNYGLHLLGGIFAGRFISNRLLFCLGMAAQLIGCLLLSNTNETFMYYGLAVFLTGSGLNVTCLNCMLTQLFDADDTRRESAFFWNYAGMNFGFLIGFTMSGFFEISQSYGDLFLLSSLGNVFAVIICVFHWSKFQDKGTIWAEKDRPTQIRHGVGVVLFILAMPIVLRHLLYQVVFASVFVLVAAVLMFVILTYVAYQQEDKQIRDKILAFLVLTLMGMVFFTLYGTAPMGLTHFIDHNVDRAFGNSIIPPQWFQNVNTIAIILGGPLLSMAINRARKNGKQILLTQQFFLALFLISAGFLILPVGIRFASSLGFVSPSWIVASFLFQSIGELFISPVGYAMVGALIPPSMQGVMMGVWMMTSGVGSTLAGYSSWWMTVGQASSDPIITNTNYSYVFSMLGLITLIVSILLLIITPKLNQLLAEKPLSAENADAEDPVLE